MKPDEPSGRPPAEPMPVRDAVGRELVQNYRSRAQAAAGVDGGGY